MSKEKTEAAITWNENPVCDWGTPLVSLGIPYRPANFHLSAETFWDMTLLKTVTSQV